jgi:hypothetical protein
VYSHVFRLLNEYNVVLDAILLKPNMCLPGEGRPCQQRGPQSPQAVPAGQLCKQRGVCRVPVDSPFAHSARGRAHQYIS